MMNFTLLKTAISVAVFTALFLTSCQKEKTPNPEVIEPEIVLEERDLASIILSDGLIAEFRSDTDGVVFEVDYRTDEDRKIIADLRGKSILERFLLLTDENTAVPEALILLEDDEDLKKRALSRGTVVQHRDPIRSDFDGSNQPDDRDGYIDAIFYTCSDYSTNWWDYDGFNVYGRNFAPYNSNWSKSTVYGSTKIGANTCRTIEIDLKNCGSSPHSNITMRTWYKPFGFYVLQNSVHIPTSGKHWTKSYTFRRYRRVTITSNSSTRFAGSVEFRHY